jgi:hypothetical protein
MCVSVLKPKAAATSDRSNDALYVVDVGRIDAAELSRAGGKLPTSAS